MGEHIGAKAFQIGFALDDPNDGGRLGVTMSTYLEAFVTTLKERSAVMPKRAAEPRMALS